MARLPLSRERRNVARISILEKYPAPSNAIKRSRDTRAKIMSDDALFFDKMFSFVYLDCRGVYSQRFAFRSPYFFALQRPLCAFVLITVSARPIPSNCLLLLLLCLSLPPSCPFISRFPSILSFFLFFERFFTNVSPNINIPERMEQHLL